MIDTLTPNPSIDRTIAVESFARGEVNRATHVRVDPGGKGVNVTRALRANGVASRAILPLGGPDGALLAALLDSADVTHVVIPIHGNTRTNVAVIEPDGTTTKLNEPGPDLTGAEVHAMTAALPGDARWSVLCGSLPAGATPEFFADLVRNRRGHVAVDTSGAALRAAVLARPDLVKPNLEELEELVGRDLPTLDDIREACRDLVRDGVRIVVASLGADGALLVSADGEWLASASVDRPRSTVGAGDCLLAGVVSGLADGLSPGQCLARGVAWGTAAVALPGSQVPGPHDVAAITVQLQRLEHHAPTPT